MAICSDQPLSDVLENMMETILVSYDFSWLVHKIYPWKAQSLSPTQVRTPACWLVSTSCCYGGQGLWARDRCLRQKKVTTGSSR